MTNDIITQLRQLYKEAFSEDSEAYLNYFFDTFESRDCYTLIEERLVNAMAYVVRKPCMISGERVELPFIVALATKAGAKRQGKASELMIRILKDLHDKGDAFVALYPAVGHNFYAKFGFETVSRMEEKAIIGTISDCSYFFNKIERCTLEENTHKRVDKINKKFFSGFDNHFIYDKAVIERLFAEYAAEDIGLYIVMRGGKDMAYCFADNKEKELNHVIGCYESIERVREWIGYKYLVPSETGEFCQFRAIHAKNKCMVTLRKSKNFFIDKY